MKSQIFFLLAICQISFVFMSQNLVAQDSYGDEMLLRGSRPKWIDDAVLSSVLTRGTRSTSSIGHHIDDEMTPRTILAQLYRKQLDVDPAVDLQESLTTFFPQYEHVIREAFRQRVLAREQDEDQWKPLGDPKLRSAAIREINSRELQRTVQLSDKLADSFKKADQQDVCASLVKKYGYRALAFQFASRHFALSDEQRDRLQTIYDEFQHNYASRQSDRSRDGIRMIADRQHAQALKLLDRNQLIMYFRYSGLLEDGENLDDAIDKFDGRMRESVRRIVADLSLPTEPARRIDEP